MTINPEPTTANSRQNATIDRLADLLPPVNDLAVQPLLTMVSAQAVEADRSRSVAPEVIAALKAGDAVRLAASANIGGCEASVLRIGHELAALAGACTSTAWVLWNHLSVFHLFAGSLGPAYADSFRTQVLAGQTVCFGAGAGSGVRGVIEGDHVRLNGRGAFASGCRYADWSGVAFVVTDPDGKRVEPLDLRFSVVCLDDDAIKIDPTWDGSGVRASATDDVHYTDLLVPLDRCVAWYGANRAETLREIPVIAHRYREDWVGLSDLWLAWMGVGLVGAALSEAAVAVTSRRSILGKKMVSHPMVQVNLGEATTLLLAAAATVEMGCRQVDDRIERGVIPSEAGYLRQMALGSAALRQLSHAMDLLQRSQGGNGLREAGSFERRYRDFQAMPMHINAHQDRVDLRLGRNLLGEAQDPF